MTIRVYQSTDAGAPILTGQNGSLIALLKACLVDGYGTGDDAKPGLGWEVEASADGLVAAFRSTDVATGQHVLLMDDTGPGAGGARFGKALGIKADQWQGFVGDVPTYTGETFPTTSQSSFGSEWCKSETSNSIPREWIVIGDARTFYYFCNLGTQTTTDVFTGIAAHGFGHLNVVRLEDDGLAFLAGNIFQANYNFDTFVGDAWRLGRADIGSLDITRTRASGVLSNGQLYSAQPHRGEITRSSWGAFTRNKYPVFGDSGMVVEDGQIITSDGSQFELRAYYPGLLAPAHLMPLPHMSSINGIPGLADRNYLVISAATDQRQGQLLLDITGPWS